jgi:hypothetical protein
MISVPEVARAAAASLPATPAFMGRPDKPGDDDQELGD